MTDVTRPTRPELTCDEIRDLAAAFVLGALTDDEMEAVRAHLQTCADPHTEVSELAGVLPVLDAAVPLEQPPAALKGRIMAAAAADLEARRAAHATRDVPAMTVPPATAAMPAEPTHFPGAVEREQRAARRSSPGTWALRIAAVVAIALFGGWNLLLQGQLGAARTYEQSVAAVLDVAGRPGSLAAILTAEGGNGPAGLAAVDSNGDVRIAMRNLAPTTGNEVYEAWVIGSDGVPVALGGFRVGETGVAYFEGQDLPTEAGIVLALTREPGPGATVPGGPTVAAGTAAATG